MEHRRSPANNATFTVGTAGAFTVSTSPGFPTSTTLSESPPLPNNLSFTDNGNGTATLSGTPAAIATAGMYTFTITAANGVSPSATQTFTLDVLRQATSVTSINRVGSAVVNPGMNNVSWTVTFANAVSGLSHSDFTLVDTGVAGSPTIASVTPTGTARDGLDGVGRQRHERRLAPVEFDQRHGPRSLRERPAGHGPDHHRSHAAHGDDRQPVRFDHGGRASALYRHLHGREFCRQHAVVVRRPVAHDRQHRGTLSFDSGTGSTRTITISNITGNGTLGISIAAGSGSDQAGNVTLAAGPSTTFMVDNTPPAVTISAPLPCHYTTGGPVTYTITYDNPNFNSSTLAAANITLHKTGTANGTVTVDSSTGSTRTVTISSITGSGTLGISVAADTASDLAGNLPAAGPSTIFTVTAAPAQFTVTSTATAPRPIPARCTAILAANAHSGPSIINFSIGGGVRRLP